MRTRSLLWGFFVWCCVSCLVFRVSTFAQESVERTLSLEQSVETALQNNQELLSAREGIRIAEQRVSEAHAQYSPKVALNASASRYLAEQYYVMPPEFGSTLMRPSRGGEADTFYSAGVFMRQPIYNGGRLRNTVRLAKADFEQSRIRFESVRSQVVYDAIKAFNDVFLARKQMETAGRALSEVEQLSAQLSENDLSRRLSFEALRGRLRRRQAERRRQEERSHMAFMNTLGLELYTKVGFEGRLETRPRDFDLAKLLAWANESRLEIRRTTFQEEVGRLSVNLSQSERYPVVALGAGYELNDPTFPLRTTQWNATLNVSLPIFDGFSSRARIRQNKLRANQNRVQRAQVEDQINAEVRDAYGDLVFWQDELSRRDEELRRLQETAARLAESRDLVARAQGQEWLLQTEEAYWEAVSNHRVALAKLEKAVGRPLPE